MGLSTYDEIRRKIKKNTRQALTAATAMAEVLGRMEKMRETRVGKDRAIPMVVAVTCTFNTRGRRNWGKRMGGGQSWVTGVHKIQWGGGRKAREKIHKTQTGAVVATGSLAYDGKMEQN